MGMVRSARTGALLGARAITRGPLGVLLMTILMMSLVYVQLLFIPALIQGAVDRTENQLIDTSTSSVQVTPADGETAIADAPSVVADIGELAGVEAVTSTARVGSEVQYQSKTGSYPVLAVDPGTYGEVFTTPTNLIEGRWLEADETDAIVLGVGVAGADLERAASYRASLREVHTGDRVTVTLLDGSTKELTVVGIYQNRLAASDGQALITKEAAAGLLPAAVDQASAIFVRTDRGAEEDVAAGVGTRHGDLSVETWLDLRHTIDDQVESFNLIKQILRFVSLLVAAVTVVIVTYVDLVGKRRTIGIERAIGIRSNAIVLSYVFKAVAYALAGTAAGAALFLGVVVPAIDAHPFPFPIGPVTLSISAQQLRSDAIILIGVAVVAAIVPAWRSVRIRILDAIWG